MRVLLVSTYDLGRQPFGLASPAAWLRSAGHDVACLDLARTPLDLDSLPEAALVALFLPMHTATRLALALLPGLRRRLPQAHFAGYGLYAAMNAGVLHAAGVATVVAGEFEAALVQLAARLAAAETVPPSAQTPLSRLDFLVPDRAGLPPLADYARLQSAGADLVAGYTEASRGCKHRCRHCPITPVYEGRFRIVPPAVVLADIRQQVAAGARHISFGDPDFFNGPAHAARIVRDLHAGFPDVTFDVTIKIEHLIRHAALLPVLASTGCLFVTSAVESFDDAILARLDKGHTRADIATALALCRDAGLTLAPTFVSFTPWTTPASYLDLCEQLIALDLAPRIAPIQLGIRLLVPAGSRLLELPDSGAWLGEFDAPNLSYRWRNPDPAVDALCERVQLAIGRHARRPAAAFAEILALAAESAGRPAPAWQPPDAAAIAPHLNEPWFCCAEPTADQLARLVG